MQQFSGVNTCKREVEIIVSLTSGEEHFRFLPITLSSLLNQNLKPDRIILWLNEEEYSLINLPYGITKFIKNGLEIRFIKDLGNYNKTIYPLKEYPESIIVTAGNNIYYPAEWLKKLYMSYIANPNDIQVNRTTNDSKAGANYKFIPDNKGGILYPPKCFTREALRSDIFLKNAPTADNIWFWVMALVHARKIRVVKNHIKIFLKIPSIVWLKRYKTITNSTEQLNNLMKFYGENIKNRLDE